jgi:hypothetical protein
MSWFYPQEVLTAAQIIALHMAPHADLPQPVRTVAAITQPAACGRLKPLDCANYMGDAQDNFTAAYTAADTDKRRAIIIDAIKGATTVEKGTDWREAWLKANARLTLDRMPPQMAADYARAKRFDRENGMVSTYNGINVNAATFCSYDHSGCSTYVTEK